MFSIRGKRRRRETDSTNTGRKRGRPTKHWSELQEPRDTINLRLHEHHTNVLSQASTGRQAASALELLPNELIQQIFFYCFEVNLPRSSQLLASALSQTSTYRSLVLFAFFKDDMVHPVDVQLFRPAEYRCLSFEEQIRLQASIVTCRWCTFARISSCLADLSRLRMVQEWHRENQVELGLKEKYGDDLSIEVADSESAAALLPDIEDEDQLKSHFRVQARLLAVNRVFQPEESMQYLPGIVSWDFRSEKEDEATFTKSMGFTISTLAAHVLPDGLLHRESWTREKLSLIQLLRQGFQWCHEDRFMQISTKAIQHGIDGAIRSQDVEALTTLLELRWAFTLCGTSRRSPIKNPGNNIPLQSFHLAARQRAKSSELLSLLVRASKDSIPSDDNILTAWAIRHQDQHEVAQWLLDIMSGTDHMDYQTDGRIYLANSVIADHRTGFVKTSFGSELGYLE